MINLRTYLILQYQSLELILWKNATATEVIMKSCYSSVRVRNQVVWKNLGLQEEDALNHHQEYQVLKE